MKCSHADLKQQPNLTPHDLLYTGLIEIEFNEVWVQTILVTVSLHAHDCLFTTATQTKGLLFAF